MRTDDKRFCRLARFQHLQLENFSPFPFFSFFFFVVAQEKQFHISSCLRGKNLSESYIEAYRRKSPLTFLTQNRKVLVTVYLSALMCIDLDAIICGEKWTEITSFFLVNMCWRTIESQWTLDKLFCFTLKTNRRLSLLLVANGSKYACSTADAAVRHRHLSVDWQRRNPKARQEEQCRHDTCMEPTELPRDVQGSTWCCSLFTTHSFSIVSEPIPFVPQSQSLGDLLENQRQILSTSITLGVGSHEHELARSPCRRKSGHPVVPHRVILSTAAFSTSLKVVTIRSLSSIVTNRIINYWPLGGRPLLIVDQNTRLASNTFEDKCSDWLRQLQTNPSWICLVFFSFRVIRFGVTKKYESLECSSRLFLIVVLDHQMLKKIFVGAGAIWFIIESNGHEVLKFFLVERFA